MCRACLHIKNSREYWYHTLFSSPLRLESILAKKGVVNRFCSLFYPRKLFISSSSLFFSHFYVLKAWDTKSCWRILAQVTPTWENSKHLILLVLFLPILVLSHLRDWLALYRALSQFLQFLWVPCLKHYTKVSAISHGGKLFIVMTLLLYFLYLMLCDNILCNTPRFVHNGNHH